MSDRPPTIGDVLAATTQLRADLMALLDRQRAVIAAIRDDIGVNFGRVDRAVDSTKALRTEVDHLSTEFAAMERQVRRLAARMDLERGK